MTTTDSSAEALGKKIRLFHNLIAQRGEMAHQHKSAEPVKKRFTNLIRQPAELKGKRSDV
jgi:hypothetical protein